MYREVRKEIREIVEETGMPIDFLYDAAEIYKDSAIEEEAEDIADYIIRGLWTETDKWLDLMKEYEENGGQ